MFAHSLYKLIFDCFLFQSVWLCYSGHVLPEYAHPYSSTNAFWLRYHCQGVSRTCGGAWLLFVAFFQTHAQQKQGIFLYFILNIHESCVISLPPFREFLTLPVMVFGQNGLHHSRGAAWLRQLSVVSHCHRGCLFLS